MSFNIDQVTPEKIRETVNQIVESLSVMVMDCVKGDIQDRLRNHCTKLVTAANQLISFAKVTAVDDVALVVAVTNQIKESHKCVRNFIDAFVRLTRNPQDQQVNVLFSQESKEFAGKKKLIFSFLFLFCFFPFFLAFRFSWLPKQTQKIEKNTKKEKREKQTRSEKKINTFLFFCYLFLCSFFFFFQTTLFY